MSNQICCELYCALKNVKEHLSQLDLSCNSLEDPFSLVLAELLRNNNALKFLDLSNNKLSDQAFRILFDSLEGNTTLRTFCFSDNAMKNFGVKHMLSFLEQRTKKIKTKIILLYNTRGLDPEGFKYYFDFFKNKPHEDDSWGYFPRRISGMDSKSCEYFKDLLISSKIEKVSLDGCDFENDGLETISEGLAGNHSLKALGIEHVLRVDQNGWCSFFDSLSSKPLPNLEKLTIRNCAHFNGANASQKFEAFLRANKHLVDLDLEESCSKENFAMLSRSLNDFKLESLNLGEADEDFGLATLSKALATNQTLTDLNLSGSNIYDDDAFIALSEAITTNTTLKALDLAYVDLTIDSEPFRKFVGALKVNHSITYLGDVDFFLDDDDGTVDIKMVDIVDGLCARNTYFQKSNELNRKRCVGHSLGRFFSDIVIDCKNLE